MGEASLALGQLVPQKRNDLVLTLAETGEVEKTQTDKKLSCVAVHWRHGRG